MKAQEYEAVDSDELPLGWTRVKRRRKLEDATGGEDKSITLPEDEECCDDPQCRRPLVVADDKETSTRHKLVGTAVFCWSDANPDWIQGYFLPLGKKPWGILLVQEDVDDCMLCADGGYRQVTMTVNPFGAGYGRYKKREWNGVCWTGGDMMRLDGNDVRMVPESLRTGSKALPLVQKYFSKLLETVSNLEVDEAAERIRTGRSETQEPTIHDLSVVVGEMTLWWTMDEKQT